MDEAVAGLLQIGAWRVDTLSGEISNGQDVIRLEARTVRLLTYLAQRAGAVVSIEELLDQVWAGVVVTPDSVYQAITSLRRQLGDDPKRPSYIATVPRLGYRLIATVAPIARGNGIQTARGPGTDDAPVTAATATPPLTSAHPADRDSRAGAFRWIPGLVSVVCLVVVGYVLMSRSNHTHLGSVAGTNPVQRSVAVLPFSDLTTQAMNEGVFADGLTESLHDAALDLSLDDRLVEHHAAIADGGVADNGGLPGFGVHLDLGDMAAVGE